MVPETDAFDAAGRSLDQFHLEDGTLMLFDPEQSSAWIECESPVVLAERY